MDPPIQVHQSSVNKCPLSFPNDFYWYSGRTSKPGRPSKRIAKHLEAVDAVIRLSTDSEETCEDHTESEKQTESGNATRILSEHQDKSVTCDSIVNISSDFILSTSPTPKVTRSGDVTTSNQDQQSSTKTTMVQQKDKQSHQQQRPYFLRSHHQGNNHIDRIHDDLYSI